MTPSRDLRDALNRRLHSCEAHIDERLRGLIMAFFMPVFFGVAGLSTDLTILKDPRLLLMAAGLIAIASIGKFAGAFIGGEIDGLSRSEACLVRIGDSPISTY
jgi:Kef-type K+ transport system membrane component KefB